MKKNTQGFAYSNRKDIHGGCLGSFSVWVKDMGDDTIHWEGFGQIPPQVGPQADGTATMKGD